MKKLYLLCKYKTTKQQKLTAQTQQAFETLVKQNEEFVLPMQQSMNFVTFKILCIVFTDEMRFLSITRVEVSPPFNAKLCKISGECANFCKISGD